MSVPPTPCLIGPTGSGKSDVAVDLARRTGGEIVCCDAYTIYRGMPILTAAPEVPLDVPHHLVAERDPASAWSAAQFADACDQWIETIRDRGNTPWIVGGTALYLRGWLKGFGPTTPRDETLRRTLRAQADRSGPESLHERLAKVDPDRAAELHPNDVTRVIRALEIVHATGRPASAQREEWDGPDRRAAIVFGLRREPDDLEDRIARRTNAMFEAGVVQEARVLLQQPLSPEARKVLGLDVLEALLAGEIDEPEALLRIATKTRRFAKKQRTFFGSFPQIRWIDVEPSEGADSVAARIVAAYERGTSA